MIWLGGPEQRRALLIEAATAIVIWAGVACAATWLGGCGGAVRTHARIATVATVALEGADRAFDAAISAQLAACSDDLCVSRVEEQSGSAALALDAVGASLEAYAAALELARTADEGPGLVEALGVAMGRIAASWERLRAALAGVGVEVPALPVGTP